MANHMNDESLLTYDWVHDSILIAARRQVEGSLLGRTRRHLTAEEIDQLKNQGNSADDWSHISVAEDFHPESIHNCRFEGEVHLGRFDPVRLLGAEGTPGLFNSVIRDCHIGSGARVSHCALLSRYFVSPGALIEGVGRISLRGQTSRFGNDLELFREELFSRGTRVAAETPFDLVAAASGPGGLDGPAAAARELADAFARRFESTQGYIGPGVTIRGVAVIENCWIGEDVVLDGAASLRESTLWAEADDVTRVSAGAVIERSLIGPGCRVDGPCRVESSALFERVGVGPGAIVKGAAVAANSHLAAGEAHDCLLGPFTMAIHQSTILSAWWPEGRGNISYGANVGSNHTGRAPDQEIFPGEGLFFGLGSSVKFPLNFREAPYTLVASGVVLLPQKVSFPFSLITLPMSARGDVSPAYNEILPGWGLLNNAYGIERQEWNHEKRNHARRMIARTEILRRDVIELFDAAVSTLTLDTNRLRDYYTESDIPGLGKNVLTEAARREALEAYRFGLLAGAARLLLRSLDPTAVSPTSTQEDAIREEARWAAETLRGDSGEGDPVSVALEWLARWLERVTECRLRDEKRGEAIIPDYRERHVCADSDPVIARCAADLRRKTESARRMREIAKEWGC